MILVTGPCGVVVSASFNQPPGSLNTTMSPRLGDEPPHQETFWTRIRSFLMNNGSIDGDGM